MDQLTLTDILDDLAYQGCRLFSWPVGDAWHAFIDRPETGYEKWQNETDHPTQMDAIRDVYERFTPYRAEYYE